MPSNDSKLDFARAEAGRRARSLTSGCVAVRQRGSELVRWRRRRQGLVNGRMVRSGQATLDYALLMGVVVPLATVCFWFLPRIMQSVYDMTCVVWGWPFP